MRLRDRRAFGKPEVVIIPMIDIMFFLLVFFIFIVVFGYAVIGRCFDDDMVAARHPVEQDFGIGTGFQVAVGHNQQLVGTGGDQIDVVA